MSSRTNLFFLVLFFWGSACTRDFDKSAVTFAAFGDWGTGDLDQWVVALDLLDYCNVKEECEFLLTLGDNFYPDGVHGLDDPQWETSWRKMYGPLAIPFYALVGNHDEDGDVQAQLDYHQIDSQWNLPGEYYRLTFPEAASEPLLDIFMINGEDFTPQAQSWLQSELAASTAAWKILGVHKPLLSNGPHGDDNGGVSSVLMPLICDKIDLILSGHEHFFAHLRGESQGCPVEQIIVGTGGASLFDINDSDTRTLAAAKTHGFGWFAVTKEKITFRMMETAKEEIYETSWQKASDL